MPFKKILLSGDIELAMKNTQSNMAAARFLNVNYETYKKYAKMYKDENGINLFEKHLNPYCKGIKKTFHTAVTPIENILNNFKPGYNLQLLKIRILKEALLAEQCENCGFNEKRITDHQVPLLLYQKDGNRNNYALNNLGILCYNCYYLLIGNFTGRKERIIEGIYNFEDVKK